MEMIRVIKEMREATNGEYPKFVIWENVRGAFSSNNGEDFRCVLEEFAHITEPEVSIPRPSGNDRKWRKCGAISGNEWSIAWRLFDAQYWGVPQRRQRIALVMDLRGQRAAEILFERTGVPGNPDESIPTWKASAGTSKERTAGKIRSGCEGGGKGALIQDELSATLSTLQDQTLFQSIPVLNDQGGSVMDVSYDLTATLRAQEHGHQPIVFDTTSSSSLHKVKQKISPAVFENHAQDARYTQLERYRPTVTARYGTGGNNMPVVAETKAFAMQRIGEYKESEQASTMMARDYKSPRDLVAESHCADRILNWIVRRLTPVECERLQGFPEIIEMEVGKMTKDEYIALNIATGQIVVDCESGEVYTTKGPSGIVLKEPKLLKGSIVNGYKVVSIRNGSTKMQCRVHRIVWIAKNGIIPDGLVVDHINNCKTDNRISNLQLLTAKENTHKAKEDGLFKSGDDSPVMVLPTEKREEIRLLYGTGEYTIRQLADKFGISKSRVHQIIHIKGWTDIGEWVDDSGKKHKPADSPRYKALGNSIALPQWFWIAQKMKPYLGEGATLGSLFDGISGFPLVWSETYGENTPVWSSEVEPFCIAVAKYHFPEN